MGDCIITFITTKGSIMTMDIAAFTTMAQGVLPHFGVEAGTLRLLSQMTNVVFHVETPTSRYVLRFHSAGPLAPLESELIWSEYLAEETLLAVRQPMRTLGGGFLVECTHPTDGTGYTAALFLWAEGQPATLDTLTEERLMQVGTYLGRLHQHAAVFTPPEGFVRPRLDWDGLFGADALYDPGEGAALFTPDHLRVFDAVAERTRAVMEALGTGPEQFGLIHGDFILKNYLLREDSICAIDFEYCGFGYYLYDLAPTLLQVSASGDYARYKAALLNAYVQLRPIAPPEYDMIETFVAARHVASCRWIASHQDNPQVQGRAAGIIAARVAELDAFLTTGRLQRKSETL
jgi:Ser/Thr protein kinase RdoA (MazF antagonist)